jgi:filamentous hemagglutinin family protein
MAFTAPSARENMGKTIKRAIAILFFAATPALAQIATDGSMGPRTAFAGNNIRIPSAIGTALGRNLFHSFSTFNVAGGQIVTFEGTAGAFDLTGFLNIIGRVTGNTASSILGTIRSTTPGTSLYLINPHGIVFGQGAVIDVNGSFYASSAHYLRFEDGTRFESRLGSDVRISFAPPSGFGFGDGFAAPLSVQGATLRVRDGGTLALVGGGVLVGGAQGQSRLQAFGGKVILVAVASPGELRIGPAGASLSGFGALADVMLQRGTSISVSEGADRSGAGSIYIRGHNVALDQALVFANTRFADGRGIDVEATGDITMRASDLTAVTTGAGNAGAIRLVGRNVVDLEGTLVDTS